MQIPLVPIYPLVPILSQEFFKRGSSSFFLNYLLKFQLIIINWIILSQMQNCWWLENTKEQKSMSVNLYLWESKDAETILCCSIIRHETEAQQAAYDLQPQSSGTSKQHVMVHSLRVLTHPKSFHCLLSIFLFLCMYLKYLSLLKRWFLQYFTS